jgi:large subunit ribosomal protein L6
MSRIGKQPIAVPATVKTHLDTNAVRVEGPKGTQTVAVPRLIQVALQGQELVLTRERESHEARALHGLTRSLIANAVHGCTEGFSKELVIEGVGYRAQAQGQELSLQVGFSHPVTLQIPEGVTVKTPKLTQLIVEGHDKQCVGQVAANIRRVCPPEPYKGKGIRYVDEVVRRKAGKAAGGAK